MYLIHSLLLCNLDHIYIHNKDTHWNSFHAHRVSWHIHLSYLQKKVQKIKKRDQNMIFKIMIFVTKICQILNLLIKCHCMILSLVIIRTIFNSILNLRLKFCFGPHETHIVRECQCQTSAEDLRQRLSWIPERNNNEYRHQH